MEGRQKLSYKDRQTIRDSFSFSNNQSLARFVRSIFITTFTIEGLGPCLLMTRFIPRFMGPWDLLTPSLLLSRPL